MVEQLFGSKTRVKLLKLFMSNPNRSFYVREITRKIDEQINSVRRELSNLLSIGIIKSDSSGHKLYYEVDQDYEFYPALSNMFGGRPLATKGASQKTNKKTKNKEKPEPAKDAISEEERALGNVELLVLGGAFTRDATAPVDVLVVGDVNEAALNNYISELENSLDSEIRYAAFTVSEFDYRKQINDKFITKMLESKLAVKIDKNSQVG